MSMNIVSYNDLPFAFIQDYDVHAWQQPHLKALPSRARAIDTFIGIQSETGIGHGPAYLKQRAQHLLDNGATQVVICLLYTSPSPRDKRQSRMPSSA